MARRITKKGRGKEKTRRKGKGGLHRGRTKRGGNKVPDQRGNMVIWNHFLPKNNEKIESSSHPVSQINGVVNDKNETQTQETALKNETQTQETALKNETQTQETALKNETQTQETDVYEKKFDFDFNNTRTQFTETFKELKNITDLNTPLLANELLLYLSEKGKIKYLECALRNGADINTRNQNGETPIWLACYYGYSFLVKLLIKNNANANIYNNDNILPLEIALILFNHTDNINKNNYYNIILFLQSNKINIPNNHEFTYLGYKYKYTYNETEGHNITQIILN
jgi:hypothetical protein